MFDLFKKKPNPSEMFADGDWCISHGEYDGNPIIVRFNAVLKPFVGKTDYNLKIGFAVPLNEPNQGSMPSANENKRLLEIEDRIMEVLREKGAVVQALAITMGTFKEFVFYAKPDIDVKGAHEQLLAEIKSHRLQCIADIEEHWDTYMEWAA